MNATITKEQLMDWMDNRTAFKLIDVLPMESYTNYHIEKAQSVPLDRDFREHIVATVPDKDETVVLYSQNSQCPAAGNAAEEMNRLGYSNVVILPEGKEGWRDAGLSLVS